MIRPHFWIKWASVWLALCAVPVAWKATYKQVLAAIAICIELNTKDTGKCLEVLRMNFYKIGYWLLICLEVYLYSYESSMQRARSYAITKTNNFDLKRPENQQDSCKQLSRIFTAQENHSGSFYRSQRPGHTHGPWHQMLWGWDPGRSAYSPDVSNVQPQLRIIPPFQEGQAQQWNVGSIQGIIPGECFLCTWTRYCVEHAAACAAWAEAALLGRWEVGWRSAAALRVAQQSC